MRSPEHEVLLHFVVDVLLTHAAVWKIVMCNVMDIFAFKEIDCDDPRARTNDFVDPLAVLEDLRSLLLSINNFTFLLDCLLVTTNAYDQIRMLKQFFSLFENLGMTDVVHVEHAVSIHSNGVIWVATIGHAWSNHGVVIFGQAVW